ncbi:MAG: hypothetical protein EHM21_00810 [Chloroflexi bacterium]|nr:MAG: hypothetical protein EHM21_00810 [Chloroflexota bacterium]
MYKKLRLLHLLAFAVMIAVALATPALVRAGGWVVITLDQLPADVIAGQPYSAGFMARQHGNTPFQVAEMRIEAKHSATGQTVSFLAKPDQTPGHYTAELLFPAPGQWEWGIQSGLHPPVQPMPSVVVGDAAVENLAANSAQAAASPPEDTGAFVVPNLAAVLLGALAVLALAAGLALILRGQSQKVARVAGGGLIVLCGVLVYALLSTVNAQATARVSAIGSAQQNQAVPVTASDVETGRQLFIAKGCVVCHTNSHALKNSGEYGVTVGPDLSNYDKPDGYLRTFLANPWNSNLDFPMPNLNLSEEEIEALVRFLNEGQAK